MENGNENKMGCYYFIESKGAEIFAILLTKFPEDESILTNCLKIISQCLKQLHEESIYLKISESDIPKCCIGFIKNSKLDLCREKSLEIIGSLCDYSSSQETLIKLGLLDLVNAKYLEFSDPVTLKPNQNAEIARIYDITKDLIGNAQITDQLITSGIFQNFITLSRKLKEVTFLEDLFIQCIYDISRRFEGAQTIKKSDFNLEEFAASAIQSKNRYLLQLAEKTIINLMTAEGLKSAINRLKSGEYNTSLMAYIAFMSQNELFVDLFDDEEIINVILKKLQEKNTSDENALSLFLLLAGIANSGEKMVTYFEQKGGIESLSTAIESKFNFIVLSALIKFLNNCLSVSKDQFAIILNEKLIIQKLVHQFSELEKMFNDFQKAGLTYERAKDSIEFHKSDVTRIILQNQKEIKENDLVSIKIAYNFLSSEFYADSFLKFLDGLKEKKKDLNVAVSEQFLNTCNSMMKIFKNSKGTHESIFRALRHFKYTKENGELIVQTLQWPTFLANIVWKKKKWKYFALYTLRFFEALMQNDKCVNQLKQGLSTIKLVATIKHFINEEDYKEFEPGVVEDDDDQEIKDEITFAEEREITKTAMALLLKLIDPTVPESIKNNILKSINEFKPQSEAIGILRAEYAVLTCINGLNLYGCDALQKDLHLQLKQNIDNIEKYSKKDFIDKEKLMADCVRSISNFVCITFNQKGKNLYEKSDVSSMVFGLQEQYLKNSSAPLNSYVMLKAFKEWLINRIEIIERVDNLEREQIYDPESFMMVPILKKEKVITDVMDALYVTYGKYPEVEKVVKINFEVIILLGYIYPQWKSKVAKSFVPNIIRSLESENLSKDCDNKAIELLKQLSQTDDKSDSPDKSVIDAIAAQNGLQVICKSIADNNYEEKYIQHCNPIIVQLGKDSKSIESCCNEIDRLIKVIQDYNSLGEQQKTNAEQVKAVLKANEQLNAFCLVDPLRNYAFDKGHPKVVKELWMYMNDKQDDKLDKILGKQFSDLEKSCPKSIALHLKATENNPEAFKQLFGKAQANLTDKDNLLLNALQSLRRNKNNSEFVLLNSRIVNACFPSTHSESARQFAKKLEFQKDLDYIFNSFSNSEDKDLATESTNLFLNLSEIQNDEMIERMIKKILRKLKQDLNEQNVKNATETLASLLPFVEHQIFIQKFDDFDILDYILRILKLIHQDLKQKTDKNSEQLLNECLSSKSVPDLSANNKKLLEDDIQLAQHINEFILTLSEPVREKVRNHKEIVGLSDVAVLLNGKPDSPLLYKDYLKQPINEQILSKNRAFENSAYILMKNNKDAFTLKDAISEGDYVLGQSMIAQSKPASTGLGQSQLLNQKSVETKELIIKQRIKDFSEISEKLDTQNKTRNIIEEYIKACNSYQPKKEDELARLFDISRLMLCLLNSNIEGSVLEPYSERLVKAFTTFLDTSSTENQPERKVFKFLESIIGKVGKALKTGPKSLKDKNLWNSLAERYLDISPNMILINPKRIMKNLKITRPKKQSRKPINKDQFKESTGLLYVNIKQDDFGCLSEKNCGKSNNLIDNLNKLIESKTLDFKYIIPTLECLSCSKLFSQKVIDSNLLNQIVQNFSDYNKLDLSKGFNYFSETLINLVSSINENKPLQQKFNQQISPEKLLNNYFEIIINEHDHSLETTLEAIKLIFGILDNKCLFYEKKIPKILMEKLGKNDIWDNRSPNYLLLIAKMYEDSSLEKQFEEINLQNEVENFLLLKIPNCKNPGKIYEEVSDISTDPGIKRIELASYILGESSKYKTNALLLCNPKNKGSVFYLYDRYEENDCEPIVSTKTIEATRNGVYQLNQDIIDAEEEKIDKLLERIPKTIEKFKQLKLVPKYLQEILDFFKKKEKKVLNKLQESLQSVLKVEEIRQPPKPNDTASLADFYKYICEQLEKGPLTNQDAKILEFNNKETANLIKNKNDMFTLNNLQVPICLRTIANSLNSTYIQKNDALILLNGFCEEPEMLQKFLSTPFYTEKSIELISRIDSPLKTYNGQFKALEKETLENDLLFLKKLTDDQKGVAFALKKEEITEIIAPLRKIISGDSNDPYLKLKAIDVLNNLVKQSPPKTQSDIITSISNEINNVQGGDLLAGMIRLIGNCAKISEANKQQIIDTKLLDFIKNAVKNYPDHKKIAVNSAYALFNICDSYSAANKPIIDSQAFQFLSNSFQKPDTEKEEHENILKAILQLGFKSPENKSELVRQGLCMGLVALLIHYSNEQNYDPATCTLVLKCMGNFSMIQKGVDVLLHDGVIPAFINFFKTYQETLPEQNKIMIGVISNLSYEPRPDVLEKIMNDKGLELIMDALHFYTIKKNEETLEACLDALTNLAAHQPALDYLSKTNVSDLLIDIIREKLSVALIYKTLRCLTRFCESPVLTKRIMDKGGHGATLDLFSTNKENLHIILQSLKLLNTLISKLPNSLKQIVEGGIPNKIVNSFNEKWPQFNKS